MDELRGIYTKTQQINSSLYPAITSSSNTMASSSFLSPFPSPIPTKPIKIHLLPFTFNPSSSLNKPKPKTPKPRPNGPLTGSWVSPDWLTNLARSLSPSEDGSGIPTASAKLDDVSDLLGGALFLPLFKWMEECGPIYRLAAGPRNFVVVSDPAIAKHVLKNYGTKYSKGLVAEVSEFLFGSGFAIAEGGLWTVMMPPEL